MLYNIFLSAHIISFTAWMAGMFYLPRLFVYHSQKDVGTDSSETFKIMERKLLKIIMNPAMIISFVTGILLIIAIGAGAPGTGYWMHLKLLLVILMGGVHGILSKYRKGFERGENEKSETFYRVLNEVPTVLMIIIVLLVVVKFI